MDFDSALSSFRTDASGARDEAQKFLQEQARTGLLGSNEVLALLDAAARPMSSGKYDWSDPASQLAWIARDAVQRSPHSAPPANLSLDCFTRAAPKTREAILQMIASVSRADYARAFVQAVTGGATAGAFPFSDTLVHIATPAAKKLTPNSPTPATPETAAILFPAVLDATKWEPMRHPIFLMLLDFLDARLVTIDTLAAYEPAFLAALDDSCMAAIARQRENRTGHFNWKYEDPYAVARHLASLLLDLAGRWKTPAVVRSLNKDWRFSDPWLLMFLVASRIRHGISVPPSDMEAIAKWPRERYCLRRVVEQGTLRTILPESCSDQNLIAEGNMVDWLCYGTELGREPDEIELVHIETRKSGGFLRRTKTTNYFFFRFRVTEEHWSKENGWCVGMAGGFEKTPGTTTRNDGGTFSQFAKWEEKPLADHVADYLG